MAAPSSSELIARSQRAVWHPCTQMKAHEALPPVAIARGQGAWLVDFEGRRYLDAVSSWWVNLFGHAHPHINAALRDQLDRLEHVMLAGFTHEPAVRLAEKLSALAGGQLGHCFFASDGASATEIALKMSAHHWRNLGRPGKNRFVALAGGYHGETVGALAVTDVPIFRAAYEPLLRAGSTVPVPDARRAEPGEPAAAFALRCAAVLERHLEQHHAETAALILEPLVQCAAGMVMYDAAYLRRARELCDRYQVHLIADEIAVGCGRSGTFFATEQAGIRPDFVCLSKGISGGYLPLSLVLCTDAVYQAFYADDVARGFLHSHSYSGNPLACRAALATLELFEQGDVLAANRALAARLDRAAEALAAHPRVRHWRRTGMIWAFEVDHPDPLFARRFHAEALRRELLLRPIGPTVYWMPPYILNPQEVDHLANRTLETLNQVLA